MDQMQQNTTAHLVLDNLIGMEDTEEMHKVTTTTTTTTKPLSPKQVGVG